MGNLELKSAIRKSEVILTYAAEKGLEINKQIADTIVAIRDRTDKKLETTGMESEFWLAYADLSRMIQPVSIEALESIRGRGDNNSLSTIGQIFSFLMSSSASKYYLNIYRFLGIIVMIFMLMVQIYWVIGAKLVSDCRQLPIDLTNTRQAKSKLSALLGDKAAGSNELSELMSNEYNIEDDLKTSTFAVGHWNNIWKKFIPVNQDSLKVSGTTAAAVDSVAADTPLNTSKLEIKYASFALDAMQSYLLPLLYGLLGAFAYIFRNIFLEIRELRFTRESNIRYVLRLQLGALTGLAIGWFFGDDGKHVFTIGNLSPLALSFVAGYGVEILFAGMDRLINSFSDEKTMQIHSPDAVEPKTPPIDPPIAKPQTV